MVRREATPACNRSLGLRGSGLGLTCVRYLPSFPAARRAAVWKDYTNRGAAARLDTRRSRLTRLALLRCTKQGRSRTRAPRFFLLLVMDGLVVLDAYVYRTRTTLNRPRISEFALGGNQIIKIFYIGVQFPESISCCVEFVADYMRTTVRNRGVWIGWVSLQ